MPQIRLLVALLLVPAMAVAAGSMSKEAAAASLRIALPTLLGSSCSACLSAGTTSAVEVQPNWWVCSANPDHRFPSPLQEASSYRRSCPTCLSTGLSRTMTLVPSGSWTCPNGHGGARTFTHECALPDCPYRSLTAQQ
ncbi:MAG: hypothetical protein HY815_18270 [Candidatus Riflebacteria bacterium]|nr:hypothetical protein [Candidatus Riflebacteria bacterium]